MIAAMLGSILPDLSARFKLTPDQNGTIAFAQALGLIIASLGIGPLIDFQGTKVGLVAALAVIAVPLFLLPQAGGFRSTVADLSRLRLRGRIIVTAAHAL